MNPIDAAVLGVVQGLTEFLPISSSAHLIIMGNALSGEIQSKFFDIALHFGTLIALIYCYKERLLKEYKNIDFHKNIAIATLPALLVGFFLGNFIDENFRSIKAVAVFLILFALLLKYSYKSRGEDRHFTLKEAFFVGIMQCLALIPGVSRSGVTMTAGMLTKHSLKASTEFSFILGIPVTFVAICYSASKLIGEYSSLNVELNSLIIGIMSSFITGILVIKYIMNKLNTTSLNLLVIYRIVLGATLLTYLY